MNNFKEIARAIFCGDDDEKKEARAAIAAMSDDEKEQFEAFLAKALPDYEGGDGDSPGRGASDEEAQRAALLATRPDLTHGQRSYLATESVARVRALLSLIPRATAASIGSRSNGTRTDGAVRASRSSRAESTDIAARFGRRTEKPTIHWEGTSLVLPLISREDAAALIEKRAKEGPLPRGVDADFVQATMPKFRSLRGRPVSE